MRAAAAALACGTRSGDGAPHLRPALLCFALACHARPAPRRAPALPSPAAAEVRSEDALAGSDDDGDAMLVSPAPRASRPTLPPEEAGAGPVLDRLPDVQSLADALEPPPVVVGLQVGSAQPPTVPGWGLGQQCRSRWLLVIFHSCRCTVPSHPPAPLHPLQSAVGNRVTLQLAGGGALRVALPLAPTGPLAAAAMEALHTVLPADTYWGLYTRWLAEGGEHGAWLGRGRG